jgi:chromosome segregation ATPase
LAVPHCDAASIAAKRIEEFVWQQVLCLLTNPALLEEKLGELGAIETKFEAELEQLRTQIRAIEQKETRLLDAMLDGEIELPMMREKAKSFQAHRQDLQKAATQLDGQITLRRDETRLREAVFRYCQVLGSQTNTLDELARQRLLRALLDEVTLDGDKVSLRGILPIPPVATQNRPQHPDDRAARIG